MGLHKFRYGLLLLLFFSTAFAATPQTTYITTVSVKPDKITLIFSQAPNYKLFALNNPHRLVLDIKQARLRTQLPKSTKDSPSIKNVRSGKQGSHDMRLVIDLHHPVRYKRTMKKNDGIWKLTIDVASASTKNIKPTEKPEPIKSEIKTPTKGTPTAEPEPAKLENKAPTTSMAEPEPIKQEIKKTLIKEEKDPPIIDKPAKPTRKLIVVIDAGHGGKDAGAVSPTGAREKDVALAIAKHLQTLFHREAGIRAVLTRDGDYYIGLRERLRIARKHKADIFVSIHADAYKTPQASGASVFALSPSGASSEAARWLAEKENLSELGSVNMDDKGIALRSVLLDLAQTGTISLSVQMGSQVLSELNKMARLHHPSVEQARFMVLKSPNIPSILVETGFISNNKEAQQLTHPAYQQRLARAVHAGVRRYFMQYPPAGTILAAKRNSMTLALEER